MHQTVQDLVIYSAQASLNNFGTAIIIIKITLKIYYVIIKQYLTNRPVLSPIVCLNVFCFNMKQYTNGILIKLNKHSVESQCVNFWGYKQR